MEKSKINWGSITTHLSPNNDDYPLSISDDIILSLSSDIKVIQIKYKHMTEKFDFEKDNIEDEENVQFEQYMADHPEIKEEKEYMRECGPEIAKFKELITLFESKHSLSELNAIKKLTPEEARMHPVREPARLDLIPIVALLNTLQNETNISPEQFDELKFGEYMTLSRAVGMINNNKVDHNR